MLPSTLALIDDDTGYTDFLSQHLIGLGVRVDVFSDSNDLLAHPTPYAYDFYVVDLILPGVDGVELIKVIRRCSNVGVLVVSGRLTPEVFRHVIEAGADMYLAKPVKFDQVVLAIRAVQRRASSKGTGLQAWTLDRRPSQLIAPDGIRVDLSPSDLALIQCFVEAKGEVVSRDALQHCLGQQKDEDASSNLNATVYRLRRRIERVTTSTVPLQTKSRVGYMFRAPLRVV